MSAIWNGLVLGQEKAESSSAEFRAGLRLRKCMSHMIWLTVGQILLGRSISVHIDT